jgi:general stress protein CsbA
MRGSLSPLALVEARRLVTHPFVLVGAALSVVVIAASVPREGQLQSFLLMGLAVLPLALGTFVAANLAALRSRRDRAEELLDTLPQPARTRTGAQLLAVLATLPIAVALLAAAYGLFGAGDGLVISSIGTRRVPAAVELLQGPLLLLALGAVGVLLGRVAPVAPLAMLLAVAILFAEVPLAAWTPDSVWRWVVPLANNIVAVPDGWTQCEPGMNRDCGIVERFDTVGMAWHLIGLAVVTAAASVAALAAGRRD